jgi:hypothetical protein
MNQKKRLNTKQLQRLVVANGNPVGLGVRPPDLVDPARGTVREDRVVHGPWDLVAVPDQRLVVLAWNFFCKFRTSQNAFLWEFLLFKARNETPRKLFLLLF